MQGADEATQKLDKQTLSAVKLALEALFQEQSVVTMPDVRVWLSAFSGAPKAQHAVTLGDKALSSLLQGGGSIVCIRCASLARMRLRAAIERSVERALRTSVLIRSTHCKLNARRHRAAEGASY